MLTLNSETWKKIKREPFQKYKDYFNVIILNNNVIKSGVESLQDKNTIDDPTYHFSGLMRAASTIAKSSLEQIIYSYSGGLENQELAEFFPQVVEFWQEYAKHHINFHNSPECDGHLVPHLELVTDEYWEALQLVCFSILFGQPEHLPVIMDILVYENDEQDALLDYLVSPWLPDRPQSDKYLRQLPYRKLQKVIDAPEEDRPALMATYLDEWYQSSRREPYYDRHKSCFFPGYWSLEAAALTVILRIDDSLYRDKPYYPKDLVEYARRQYIELDENGNPAVDLSKTLRCEAGEPCPKTGEWWSPANEMQKRSFKQGNIMPEIDGNDWGQTIWYMTE